MNPIFLSICIPTFNRAELLNKALISALAIRSEQIEILVQDNGSEDATISVCDSFSDSRLFVERNSSNIGVLRNVYRLFQRCRGEYVLMMTDDDYFLPGACDAFIEFLKLNKPSACKTALFQYLIKSKVTRFYSPFSSDVFVNENMNSEKAQIFWFAHILTGCCYRRELIDLDLYERNIHNIYPSMLLMASMHEKLAFWNEPLAVHIWENEVFWDCGATPEETGILLEHRAEILEILKDRLPLGFIKEAIYIINKQSMNVPKLMSFLDPSEIQKLKIQHKYVSYLVYYERLITKIFQPVDNFFRQKVGMIVSKIFA